VATTATDALVIVFTALAAEEQDDVFERLHQARLRRDASEESLMGRCIRSMQRVAEHVGHVPSVDEYKSGSQDLRAADEDVETFSRLYKHFGSWARATEALALSDAATPRRIEARFSSRKVGKVWRYTPETLREVLLEAAQHWGYPPSVAEFEWWRERELELRRASGDPPPHLPSSSPYRRRHGTWEGALLHFGFSADEVAVRLERGEQPRRHEPDAYLPDGLPIAELSALVATDDLPLDSAATARLRTAYATLPRRSRYVLTVRLGIGGAEPLTLKRAAEPLALSIDRIRQLQVLATNELCRAVASEKGADAGAVRDDVLSVLGKLGRFGQRTPN
jgi:hypothetical protein